MRNNERGVYIKYAFDTPQHCGETTRLALLVAETGGDFNMVDNSKNPFGSSVNISFCEGRHSETHLFWERDWPEIAKKIKEYQ